MFLIILSFLKRNINLLYLLFNDISNFKYNRILCLEIKSDFMKINLYGLKGEVERYFFLYRMRFFF